MSEMFAKAMDLMGLTPHFDDDGDNTVQTVIALRGKIGVMEVQNPNEEEAWIQLYDEKIVTGVITKFESSDGGSIVKATCVAHGLVNNDIAVITESTNFDGTYTITKLTADTYEFTKAWTSTPDETGAFSSHKIIVGATTPVQSYLVKAGDGVEYGAFDRVFLPSGIRFWYTIRYACTTTPTGAGDPSTGLVVNILYKKHQN